MSLLFPAINVDLSSLTKLLKTRQEAEARLKKFLKDNSDCQGAIDLAGQHHGLSGLLATFDATLFVDPRGDKPLLKTLMTDLGFQLSPGNDTRLGGVVGEGGIPAITNPATHTVYLGAEFFNSTLESAKDQTIVHELLHVMFGGDHVAIARGLGLNNARGEDFGETEDGAAAGAVADWLEAGCK